MNGGLFSDFGRDSRTPRDVHDHLIHIIGDERRRLLGLGVDVLVELLHHIRKDLVRGLVQIGDGDSRGQTREVRMLGSHVGRRLGRELVELVGRDAVVDALDDLLGQDLRRAFVRPRDSVRNGSISKNKPPTSL